VLSIELAVKEETSILTGVVQLRQSLFQGHQAIVPPPVFVRHKASYADPGGPAHQSGPPRPSTTHIISEHNRE
jgi:hypothetical protein